MGSFYVKIKTSIMVVFAIVVFLIVGTIMFFQYHSSNEFALLTTQKVFDRISDKVINQIQSYDIESKNFINLSKHIKNIEKLPKYSKKHILLPIITEHINNNNYVYGIYLGYSNDDFYIVYNLNLSKKMRDAQKAPKGARWLVKKNIKENNIMNSYKIFLDKDLNTILKQKEVTNYRATKRPWYQNAIKSDNIVKTKPYIFSSVQEPGITYAQAINKKKTVVLSLDVTLSSLSKLLASQNLVDGSASFIFKNDGTIIGQYDNIKNKKITNLNKEYSNIFIKDGDILDLEKQKIVTINGKEYIKYTTLLKSSFNTKDYLTIVSPMDTIMKPYKDKIYKTLFITFVILLLFILPIVFFAVRLIVNPILALQEENKKIKDGNFKDVKLIDSFMIEIASLSNSLVSMSNSIEESQRTLEQKVEQRTSQLEQEKENVEQILANILLPVLITSKNRRKIVYANKFAQDLYEISHKDIIDAPLDSVYTLVNGPDEIIKQIQQNGCVEGLEEEILTNTGKKFIGLLSVTPILYNDEECYIGMTVDITKQKDMENEVRAIHKHTRESIEYASLIQGALIPEKEIFLNYFKDSFVSWVPKDTVGGDIWLFDDLRVTKTSTK